MANLIQQRAPQAIIEELTITLRSLRNNFQAYFVDLTDDQKSGRSMAEGREGLARLVAKIATEHVDYLSRVDDPQTLTNALDYDANLESVRQALNALMEQITETQMANGMDIMTMVDRYSTSLQANRNNNAALDLAMREVDEWNKRFGRRSDNGAPPVVDQP